MLNIAEANKFSCTFRMQCTDTDRDTAYAALEMADSRDGVGRDQLERLEFKSLNVEGKISLDIEVRTVK